MENVTINPSSVEMVFVELAAGATKAELFFWLPNGDCQTVIVKAVERRGDMAILTVQHPYDCQIDYSFITRRGKLYTEGDSPWN